MGTGTVSQRQQPYKIAEYRLRPQTSLQLSEKNPVPGGCLQLTPNNNVYYIARK